MGWRDYQTAADKIPETEAAGYLELMVKEYHNTLARYRSPKSESLPQDEFGRMLTRLDVLFRELTSRGIDLPLNTPEGQAYIRDAAKEVLANEEAA